MLETWICPNRRAIAAGFAVPLVLVLMALLAWWLAPSGAWGTFGRAIAAGLAVLALLTIGSLTRHLRQPRLAYQQGFLLVFLTAASPFRVPVDLVECFFLGQSEAPTPTGQGADVATRSVVVRLAERATDWKHRDVKPSLGRWCDGYITIRGTWCEPITPELVGQLNHRLNELHRQRRLADRDTQPAADVDSWGQKG